LTLYKFPAIRILARRLIFETSNRLAERIKVATEIPSNVNETIPLGSPWFWALYDRFTSNAGITDLIANEQNPLVEQMRKIIHAAHESGAIYKLSCPERGWTQRNAWLAIKTATVQQYDGSLGVLMRSGDVVVVEHQWDRDVIITHCPAATDVSGYLLSGQWPEMVGLFLPLFDRRTIERCIEFRLAQNFGDALRQTKEEAKEWDWH
jgi:hypothetical protein